MWLFLSQSKDCHKRWLDIGKICFLFFKAKKKEADKSTYYMALSHEDWELQNSRIWSAKIDIDRGLDFPI